MEAYENRESQNVLVFVANGIWVFTKKFLIMSSNVQGSQSPQPALSDDAAILP